VTECRLALFATVREHERTVAHLEGFEPPPPSSEDWYRALSPMFTVTRSRSLPLLQADCFRLTISRERGRLPANIQHCGQIVVQRRRSRAESRFPRRVIACIRCADGRMLKMLEA
jgi:hypothetical protein